MKTNGNVSSDRVPRTNWKHFWPFLLVTLLTLAIFFVDTQIPLGIAIGAFYSFPIILSLWLARRSFTLVLTVLCTALTVAGFLLSPNSEEPIYYAVFNRGISIVVITAFAIIGTTARAADHLSRMLQRSAMGDALTEAEARYRAMVTLGGQSGQAIVMIGDDNNREGVQVYFNEVWLQMTGYSESEMNKMTFFELIHPDDREFCLEYHRRNMINEDAEATVFEMRTFKKNGELFPVEVACGWAVYRGKRVNVAYVRDITARKRMEERLQYLASFPELAQTPIVEMDCEGIIHYMNPTAKQLFTDISDGNPDHPFLADWHNICERTKDAESPVPFISEIKTDSGWYERTIWNIKRPDGQRRLRIDGNDISERKVAEDALITAEQNYRNSLDESPLGIRILSVDNPFIYVNKAALRMHGYDSAEEYQNIPIEQRYTPETVAELQERAERIRRGEPVTPSYQISAVQKDGNIHRLQVWRKDVLWDGQIHSQLIYEDTTEQFEAAKKLKEALLFNNSLLENSPNPISVTNIDTSVRYVNPAFERLFGLKAADIIGVKFPYPWWAEESVQSLENIVAVPQELRPDINVIETIYKKANGEKLPVQISIMDVKEGNTVKYHLANYVDMTQVRNAERTLRESEVRFRQLANSTFEGIVISESGIITDCNQTMARMLRTSESELIGRNVLDFIAPESYETARRNVTEGVEKPYEIVCQRMDGTKYLVEARAQMVTEGNKSLRITAVRDITERKQIEAALKEGEEKWRSLIQNTPAGIAVTALDGRLIEANDSLLKMHGFGSKEEFAASAVADRYVNISDRDNWTSQVLTEGKIEGFEMQLKRKDGELFWASLTSIVRETFSGEKQFVSVVMDITERKQLQQQLILSDRLASIGQLSAGIAHELNNPLTGVIGFSELLLARENLPPDIKEELELINREAARTAEIVKGLLTFARKQRTEKEPVDIKILLQDVLRLRMYEQTVNNIAVETHLAENLPMVNGNGAQLQQVFINLIVNAEQAMTAAHKGGLLKVRTESDGRTVRICIEDNGPGIKPENMNQLFTPFFTTKDVGKGTGLGLSISHGIIENHSGHIHAESEYDRGATFFIELPAYSGGEEES